MVFKKGSRPAAPVSLPRPTPSAPGRPSPTQKLDQALIERYRTNLPAFQRSTNQNLLVGVGLLAMGAGLAYVGVRTVGISSGGLALITMAAFPILLALTVMDDVRWRRSLIQRKGVPPPRPKLSFRMPSRAPKPVKTVEVPSTSPGSSASKGAGSPPSPQPARPASRPK